MSLCRFTHRFNLHSIVVAGVQALPVCSCRSELLHGNSKKQLPQTSVCGKALGYIVTLLSISCFNFCIVLSLVYLVASQRIMKWMRNPCNFYSRMSTVHAVACACGIRSLQVHVTYVRTPNMRKLNGSLVCTG